jgi:hypothetical protein
MLKIKNIVRRLFGKKEEVEFNQFEDILIKLSIYSLNNPNKSIIKCIYDVSNSAYHTSIVQLTDDKLCEFLNNEIKTNK